MRLACLLPLLALPLAACTSGTSVGTQSTAPRNDPVYQTLSSDAAVTSTLGGVALKLRENPDEVTLSASSGTLTHSSGATTLDDGTYRLTDPDGFAINGLMTDGVSALISTPANGFRGNYDYARVYNQGYVVRGVPYSATGVYGVVTAGADMPTSGTAIYRGEAEGSFATGTELFDLDDGTSTVTANFGSGAVTVDAEGFEAVSRSTGRAADAGFDAVRIEGMRITGNGFSGGTITTRKDGRAVDVTGARRQSAAQGRFFGMTTTGRPDEVGGIAYLRGSTGAVTTIFLAD